MPKNFNFETFGDKYGSIFEEYLSSVISKLREADPKYRFIEEQINSLYGLFPKVMAVFDTKKADGLVYPSRSVER